MADESLGTIYWDLAVRTQQLQTATAAVTQAEKQIVASGDRATMAFAGAEKQATRTAGALGNEAAAATESASATQSAARAADQVAASGKRAAGSAAGMADSFSRSAGAAESSHKATRKLESGLVAVAVASADTSGAVGQIIQGLLMFGVGSTAILGVAAAVAVLSKGYQLLTEDSAKAAEKIRLAREEQEKTRQEARTPIQKADETLNTLVQARLDQQQKIADFRRQLVGNGDDALGSNRVLNQEIAVAEDELDRINKDVLTARKSRTQAGIEERGQQLRDLVEARQLGLQIIDGDTQQAALVTQLRALEADTNKPLKDRIEARRILNDLTTEERDRARELRDIVLAADAATASLTRSLTDDARVALQKFDEDARRQVENLTNPADQAAARAALHRQRRVAVENLTAAQALDSVAGVDSGASVDQLNEAISKLVQKQHDLTVGGAAYESIERKISALQDQITQRMQGELDYAKGITDAANRHEAADTKKAKAAAESKITAHQQLELIEQSVRAALDLASAFGLVGGETAKILNDVLSLATSIPDLSKSLSDLKSGKGNAAGVVAAALPVVGAVAGIVSGLFGGDSPAEQERRRMQEENTKALEKLTDTIGEFGIAGVTGSALTNASDALGHISSRDLGNLAAQAQISGGASFGSRLDARLAQYDTSRAKLQALADQLGISANFLSKDVGVVADSFDALRKAIAATELARFSQTFAGQADALRLQAQLFNKTPAQQLQDLANLVSNSGTDTAALQAQKKALQDELLHQDPLAKTTKEGRDATAAILKQLADIDKQLANPTEGLGSPALKKALAGLDLNTVEGRAQALQNLQQLSLLLNQPGGLTAADLGGLTGDQFTQALLDLKDLIDQANQTGGPGGSSTDFSVARTITDNQADQLIGLGVSANVYLSEISARSTEVRDLLGGLVLAFTGIQPPSVPAAAGLAPTATSGGGGVVINLSGDIQIAVQGAPGDTPFQLGDQAAQKLIDGLLNRLGNDYRLRRIMSGQAGVV